MITIETFFIPPRDSECLFEANWISEIAGPTELGRPRPVPPATPRPDAAGVPGPAGVPGSAEPKSKFVDEAVADSADVNGKFLDATRNALRSCGIEPSGLVFVDEASLRRNSVGTRGGNPRSVGVDAAGRGSVVARLRAIGGVSCAAGGATGTMAGVG